MGAEVRRQYSVEGITADSPVVGIFRSNSTDVGCGSHGTHDLRDACDALVGGRKSLA